VTPKVGDTLWRMRWVVPEGESRGRIPEPLACVIFEVEPPGSDGVIRRDHTTVRWAEDVGNGREVRRHAFVGLKPHDVGAADAAAVIAYHPPTAVKLYATPAGALDQARREAEARAERAAADVAQAARQVDAITEAIDALEPRARALDPDCTCYRGPLPLADIAPEVECPAHGESSP